MRFRVSFFAVMMFLALLLSGGYYSIVLLCAAVIHELGHMVAARLRGVKLSGMDIGIFGARLSVGSGISSYSDEIFVCAAGPLFNLISADIAAIIQAIEKVESTALTLFIISSLCLCITNLLPIKSFDGGRILSSILSLRLSPFVSETVVNILSFISLFSLWCVSVYLLLKSSASLSLFVFSISLFANIFLGHTPNDKKQGIGSFKKDLGEF